MPGAWRKLEETTSYLEVLSTTPKPNGHYEIYARHNSTALMRISIDGPELNKFQAVAPMILWKTNSGKERRHFYKSGPTCARCDIVTDNFSIPFTDDDISDED